MTVYGGTDLEKQARKLQDGVDIIVGTPGRVMDMTKENLSKWTPLLFSVLTKLIECLTWVSFRTSRGLLKGCQIVTKHYYFPQPSSRNN